MRKSVNGGGSEYRLIEELSPLAKGPVGGQDCRSSLVPTVDDFIKILRSRGSHGFQSKVVENDHVGAQYVHETTLVAAIGSASVEVIKQCVGLQAKNVVAPAHGLVTEPLREMRLPHPRRAQDPNPIVSDFESLQDT